VGVSGVDRRNECGDDDRKCAEWVKFLFLAVHKKNTLNGLYLFAFQEKKRGLLRKGSQ
jgi:hypothetical protein